MPRNGSGVASKPAGTTAVANTTIESAKFNSVVDDVYAMLNEAAPVTSGGTGATSVSAAQTALSLDNKVVYATKAANYTALATDNNAVHVFTATATVSLTAAATLGANWHYRVVADGATITIDPNASETINGSTTLALPTGHAADIICDGTNFDAVVIPLVVLPRESSVVTLSGTEQLITVPANVTRVSLLIVGISSNGTSAFNVQLGDAGGVETSGYEGSAPALTDAAAVSISALTAGFSIRAASASTLIHGCMELIKGAGNTWIACGNFGASNSSVSFSVFGSKTLSDTLTTIRVTTGNGTDTFDAGTIMARWS